MNRGFILSLTLHVGLIILLIFGLPDVGREIPSVNVPATFDVIAEETLTPKPAPRPLEPKPTMKPKEEPPHKVEVKPTELEEKPVEKQEEQLPEPEPKPPAEEKPRVSPTPEVKPDLTKVEDVPERPVPLPHKKPQVKPTLKPQEAKKEKEDFSSILKDLKQMKEKTQAQDQLETEQNTDEDGGVGKLGDQVTVSEMDAVRSHLAKCWKVPAGVRDAQDLKVKVRIWLNADGTVQKAEVIKDIFMQSNPLYKVASDRALNAVLDKNCNPLPFPKKKYELWKETEITFDPKKMFG